MSSDALGFRELKIEGWRQFGYVHLSFHPRLTVLTGANATGKTTLLNLLGRHFQWTTQWLGTPFQARSGAIAWAVDNRGGELSGQTAIGQLTYTNGIEARFLAQQGSVTYPVALENEQFVPGLYLSSHRSLSAYQALPSLPTQFSATSQLFAQYFSEISARHQGGYTGKSAMLHMKEALFSAALYGYGNQAVEANPEARVVWEGFQAVLRQVLPPSLGFNTLTVRAPEIVMQTSTGDFLIDAVSGGLSSLIELSWQIYLRSREYDGSFVVCMDEPENHLHPSLQRALIPSLLDAFPRITFIVATHSPFVVTAVDDSNVFVLDYEEGSVQSRLLDAVNKAASSDETLRRVLGLETTMPLWVERRLAQLLAPLDSGDVTTDTLRELQGKMRELGLDEELPAAIDALTLGRDETPQ